MYPAHTRCSASLDSSTVTAAGNSGTPPFRCRSLACCVLQGGRLHLAAAPMGFGVAQMKFSVTISYTSPPLPCSTALIEYIAMPYAGRSP